MHPQLRVLNPQFRARNLVAYNFAAFACISLVVFLLASQPFYLSDVIGISPDQIGKVTGSLGVVDELMVIATSPLIGTLNDRLQGMAWKAGSMPSGPRILQLAGFGALALALLGYGQLAAGFVWRLYVLRSVFAVGVAAVMGIAVVMLHEASNSDFTWLQIKFWTRADDPRGLLLADDPAQASDADEDQLFMEDGEWAATQKQKQSHGKLSALLGLCAGLGAILAVAVFLPLPARLSLRHTDWSTAKCLEASYTILGAAAVVCGALVFVGGYDSVKQRRIVDGSRAADEPNASYVQLMREAVIVSLNSRQLQLAYMGGFIARCTAIATSVFTPLIVYKFYLATGTCGSPEPRADAPPDNNCYNAFIFLAVLTGVASVASLVSAPAWSYVVDAPKMGCLFALLVASVLNCTGCFALCVLGLGSAVYDPRNAACFILLSVIGVAQMGLIISSMSLVSKAGQLFEDAEHRVIGSITGLYNLSGGMGILLISKLGGTWSDRWVFGPFFILGLFNLLLVAASGMAMRLIR
ncbi:hypothetical protein METBIDRAFT_44271 [Metschnikowia bicuspidata var. bicuspidata NRRL YB-4993]|uniref:MFS general substrate transporter n=1 Tax=Metschnikowia bicuspidata var. bicuspidata NRRL YB-4993 TaxID=869754 RepID=A0A1A0H8U9_9ASCO|nr:hypothetical protein METBIDRAFT_44271 [Metschnikowia bicuspidata var. bicuspidata NRRL YB-4993]OBA20436.1 hypothetical protein METBIDRAFT_44271 [Metschnikowia bicuspidata var. bicuspidata NRRL YB-4993]